MRRLTISAAVSLAVLGLALTGPPVKADSLLDPLHGMICSGAGTGCSNAADNGTFTPLANVTNWGFSISPGPATGNLTLVFGVPTDEINTGTFLLPTLTDNGGGTGTTVFSRVSFFNAGSPVLSTFLGLGSFSPTDNFSNLSAGTLAADPGFLGNFMLFTATINGLTLSDVGSTTIPNDFSFGANLPAGTFITGLFNEVSGPQPGNNIGTAASAHLVVQNLAVPGPLMGAGLPGLISACLGMIWCNRRRKLRLPFISA